MDSSGFYSILFHGIYGKKWKDKDKHPYMFISLDEYEKCIEMLRDRSVTFLDTSDLDRQMSGKANVLLTFDDGYYNNMLALNILERYNLKATFFFVKNQVINQKLFWWDVYYAHMIKLKPFAIIYEEMQDLKKFTSVDIERGLKERFGEKAFDATEDLFRPMRTEELKEFSKHASVRIGVHSASHEILTNCSKEDMRQEMISCKDFLEKVTSEKKLFISYPNGNFDDKVVATAKELGFKFGFTTISGLNESRDLEKPDRLELKRNTFPIPRDIRPVIEQFREFVEKRIV